MSLDNFERVYENAHFFIEVEENSIPWIKVFAKEKVKELSFLSQERRLELFNITNAIETAMIEFYKPDKVNIASFGNYVPQVHMHIMARFKEDAFFPEPMWGKRQREDKDFRGDFSAFIKKVQEDLKILKL